MLELRDRTIINATVDNGFLREYSTANYTPKLVGTLYERIENISFIAELEVEGG